MTYQAVRNNNVRYNSANAYAGYSRPAAKSVSAAERERVAAMRREQRRRREAEYIRNARADAAAAEYMELQRRRHEQELARIRAHEAKLKREQAEARKAEKAREKEAARLAEEAFRRNEIKVARQKMPWQFILGVAIAFVLLLSMVFSFAQISEANTELAGVKSQIKDTQAQAEKIRVLIEERNDLTEIERIAVEEYNMVKEGSVQKKYIYVSDGDRVVLENEEKTETNRLGGMLSGVSSAFDGLLDYIK